MSDLVSKGFYVFTTLSEHLPIDFIAYKAGKVYRMQVKYSTSGYIPFRTSWSDKNGSHTKNYEDDDFDYYALYNPIKDLVIYPSIKFKGKTIRFYPLTNKAAGYWYEDFLSFTDEAEKRIFKTTQKERKEEPGAIVKPKLFTLKPKIERLPKDELEKLVWKIPSIQLARQLGVSDRTIGKWCQYYQISKPPRGYWASRTSCANL